MFRLRFAKSIDDKFQGYVFILEEFLKKVLKLDSYIFKDNKVDFSGSFKGIPVKGDMDSDRIHVLLNKGGKRRWTDIHIRGNSDTFKPAEALAEIVKNELDTLVKERF